VRPDELLLRHPGETLRWLRRQLRLNRRAFAAWRGVPVVAVAGWEQGASPIPLALRRRLAPLVTRSLAAEEGRAWLATLGEEAGEQLHEEEH
jgi:transcriptional regulator with XRE-family HTH domain